MSMYQVMVTDPLTDLLDTLLDVGEPALWDRLDAHAEWESGVSAGTLLLTGQPPQGTRMLSAGIRVWALQHGALTATADPDPHGPGAGSLGVGLTTQLLALQQARHIGYQDGYVTIATPPAAVTTDDLLNTLRDTLDDVPGGLVITIPGWDTANMRHRDDALQLAHTIDITVRHEWPVLWVLFAGSVHPVRDGELPLDPDNIITVTDHAAAPSELAPSGFGSGRPGTVPGGPVGWSTLTPNAASVCSPRTATSTRGHLRLVHNAN